MADEKRTDVLREVTPEVIEEAAMILQQARYGALATLDPADGAPQASRVGIALLGRFTPLLLVSALSAHTAALRADPRCSLLVGDVGKGDPLAHPRLTLSCIAREIGRNDPSYAATRAAYLDAQPKAALYVDLADFTFMALEPKSLSFVGGFGRAYAIAGEALGG